MLAFALALIQLFTGAIFSGVTVDEPTHVLRLEGWLKHGWYVPDAFLPGGELPAGAREGPSVLSPYVYGPVFSALAHAVNVVAGNEGLKTVSDGGGAWDVRHMVTALVGAFTAVICGVAVRALTSSWRFGLWTALVLLSIPLWTGMSFFNPKDIPSATGYTMVTVGLVLALVSSGAPGERLPWARTALVGFLVGGGFYLGAGTRLAFWMPMVISILAFGVLVAAGGPRPARRNAWAALTGLAAGALALVLTYPALFEHPLELLRHSLGDSSGYEYIGNTLTAGRLVDSNPPLWYLPTWGFASVPVLIGLFALTGVVTTVWSWLTAGAGAGRLRVLANRRDAAVALVLLQFLLLPLGSMAVGATMYSGLRQHLYVLPAVAILAGVGAARIWRKILPGSARWPRWVVLSVMSLAVIVPLAEQTLLFPYNYTYVNPVAGIGGINGNWETDYWWSSEREALDLVPDGVVPGCSATLNRPGNRTAPLEVTACVDYWSDGPSGPPDRTGPEMWVLGRNRAGNVVPDYCDVAGEITRWVRGERVVMSYVLKCDTNRTRRP